LIPILIGAYLDYPFRRGKTLCIPIKSFSAFTRSTSVENKALLTTKFNDGVLTHTKQLKLTIQDTRTEADETVRAVTDDGGLSGAAC